MGDGMSGLEHAPTPSALSIVPVISARWMPRLRENEPGSPDSERT